MSADKAITCSRRKIWCPAIILCLLLAFSFFQFVVHPSKIELKDYQVYVEAANRLQAGASLYGSLTSSGEFKTCVGNDKYCYIYPPFLALVLSKFLFLSPDTLQMLWCLVGYVCLLVSAVCFASLLSRTGFGECSFLSRLVGILFFLICFEPIYAGIVEGQVNTAVLFLISFYLFSLSQKYYHLAGVALGFAAIIKITPVILLLAAVKWKRWKVIRAFLITIVVLFGLMFSDSITTEMLRRFLLESSASSTDLISFNAAANFVFDKELYQFVDLSILSYVRLFLRLLILLLVLVPLWKIKESEFRELRTNGALVCLMVILAPLIWFHHFNWIIIPLFILVLRDFGKKEDRFRYWTICAAFYLLISKVFLIHVFALSSGNLFFQVFSASLPSIFVLGVIYFLLKDWTLVKPPS